MKMPLHNKYKLHNIKYKSSNQGMTMVEVVIGFVVLVVLLEGLYGTIRFSHNMYTRSVDLKKAQEVLNENIYKKNVLDNADRIKTSLKFNVVNAPARAGDPPLVLPATLMNGTPIDMDLEVYEIQTYKLDGATDAASDEINMKMYLFKKDE